MSKEKRQDDNPQVTVGVLNEVLDKSFKEWASSITGTILEAVNFGFANVKKDIEEIKSQLWKLDRRVFAIEEILTEHGKELRHHNTEFNEIKKLLLQLQKQDKADEKKVLLLEQRVGRLEAKVL